MFKSINLIHAMEFRLLFFFAVLVLLNWPFMTVFTDKPGGAFTYLFFVWAVIILFLILLTRKSTIPETPEALADKNDGK
jgi:uncharacterized membrane-anchored protein YitT (DUF2179 family)